ncbi:hypothetical protein B9Z55_006081 [Caenorhabditis nigoni]|uniref:Uncharacterized protein n=1 Tax=Caenorhabditis nigoni TaxID=1611254 RepID=A0A2G5V3P0_9PELO|nr:hypothetical protein B9Z55_006081 [Caenorhabditis nigoni]
MSRLLIWNGSLGGTIWKTCWKNIAQNELLKFRDGIIERQNMGLLAKQDTIMNFEIEVGTEETIIHAKFIIIEVLEAISGGSTIIRSQNHGTN